MQHIDRIYPRPVDAVYLRGWLEGLRIAAFVVRGEAMVVVNSLAAQALGEQPAKLMDGGWLSVMEESERERVRGALGAVCAGKKHIDIDVRALRGRWLHLVITPAFAYKGFCLVLVKDVTKAQRLQEAGLNTAGALRYLMEAQGGPAVVFSGKAVLYANPMAAQLFGMAAGALAAVPPERIDRVPGVAHLGQMWKLMHERSEQTYRTRGPVRLADGQTVVMEARAYTCLWQGEEAVMLTMSGAGERAPFAAPPVQTEAYADLAHEIRSPLSVILSIVQGLRARFPVMSADSSLAGNINLLQTNVLRMLRMANNILDATRLQSCTYRAEMRNVDLRALVHDVARSVDPLLCERDIALTLPTRRGRTLVACDAVMMERAFLNLMSNAVKYTPPGGRITVSLATRGQRVCLSVADTGCGIPPEKLDAIFRKYSQPDAQGALRTGTSGLGLSIVQALMRLQGGCVTVRSSVGQGSVFTLQLPRILCAEGREPQRAAVLTAIDAVRLEMSAVADMPVAAKVRRGETG